MKSMETLNKKSAPPPLMFSTFVVVGFKCQNFDPLRIHWSYLSKTFRTRIMSLTFDGKILAGGMWWSCPKCWSSSHYLLKWLAPMNSWQTDEKASKIDRTTIFSNQMKHVGQQVPHSKQQRHCYFSQIPKIPHECQRWFGIVTWVSFTRISSVDEGGSASSGSSILLCFSSNYRHRGGTALTCIARASGEK